jgi:DNA ligase (NAD+)
MNEKSKKQKNHPLKDPQTFNKKEAQEEIEALRKEIAYHNKQYYAKNDPKISDIEYDKLFKQLQDLENAFPEFQRKDSPTQKVGSKPVSQLKKVKHAAPMMSLHAVGQEKEAHGFWTSLQEKTRGKSPRLILEPKFDGFSLEVIYENGRFIRGSTRGDGNTGEDISHNLHAIKSFPQKLRSKNLPSFLSVRAEVIMSKKGFQQLNKERIEQGEKPFANPRNAAAGMMRLLDPRKVRGKYLDVIFYESLKCEGRAFKSHWDKLKKFKRWGLHTDSHNQKKTRWTDVEKYHRHMESKRDAFDYEIDGIVIKCDSQKDREKLGHRERSPHWALAWKFHPRQEITKLVDIVVQVGRTGMLTPVALLQPVDIGGVTVSRATLHNEEEVLKKHIRIGDKVRIARAGDVIPEVVESLNTTKKTKNSFSMPKKCPSCGSRVYKEGAYYFCVSGLTCHAQLVGRIMHYASRPAFNIDGLGEETIKQLVDKHMVHDMADLYNISEDDLKQLEGFSAKSAKKLHNSIHKNKDINLDRFLYALGIRHVGRHIARVLAQHFAHWEKIAEANRKSLSSIQEIGPEIAQSITSFFRDLKNTNVIHRICQAGVRIKKPRIKASKQLQGQTIVFTGELKDYTRDEAKEEAEVRGLHAASSVSDNTDYVIVGENPGSKYDQAKQKNVKILNENQFNELISQARRI